MLTQYRKFYIKGNRQSLEEALNSYPKKGYTFEWLNETEFILTANFTMHISDHDDTLSNNGPSKLLGRISQIHSQEALLEVRVRSEKIILVLLATALIIIIVSVIFKWYPLLMIVGGILFMVIQKWQMASVQEEEMLENFRVDIWNKNLMLR